MTLDCFAIVAPGLEPFALAEAQAPLPFADLRARCRVRTATLYERLAALSASGRVIKQGDNYRAGTD